MFNHLKTKRLRLTQLSISDAVFILELVNSPGWLKFIGDRRIYNLKDAKVYIYSIMRNTLCTYWVVMNKNDNSPMGIITFIKRDFLAFYDIGFAFLPEFLKQGYAYEATRAVLKKALIEKKYSKVFAITLHENTESITLLEKLSFHFEQEVQNKNEALQVYAISNDLFLINETAKSFFRIFDNTPGRKPDWRALHRICIPEIMIVKKTVHDHEVFNLDSFLEPRKKLLSDGTLTDFSEIEISHKTIIEGNLAQRLSSYEKTGYLEGKPIDGKGSKLFQFIRTSVGWKINSLTWEDK